MSPWTFEYSLLLPAPAPRAFAAWTDAATLETWFAEHAEVDLRPGGAFRFWGRCTYGTPDESLARQRLLHVDPPRSLSFEWHFAGVESRVELGFTPAEGGQARLLLRHVFPALPPEPRPRELIEDLWRMSLGNLQAFLRGGAGLVLPNFAAVRPEVRLCILIDAPRERVFKALTEPAQLDQWIASAAAVEPRVGGRYSYGWSYPIGDAVIAGGPTQILELIANEKLVTDWPDWRGDSTQPATQISWVLAAEGEKTLLTLTHRGFGRTADLCDYPQGWWAFLIKLSGLTSRGSEDAT